MKILLIFILFFSGKAIAQTDSTFKRILAAVPEIEVKDSLQITTESWMLHRLDSNNIKKWFRPLIGATNNNRLRNRSYFLAGKITTMPAYDLLFMLEEKRKEDTVEIKVIHFITIKKTGQYISDVEAAVSGTKK